MAGPKVPRRPGVPSIRPVQTRPVQTRPVQTRPVQTRPVQTRPEVAPRVAATAAAGGSGRDYAERLVLSVIARKQRVAEQFYAMGAELRELSRPECFRALGFSSFVELIETRKVVSRMTALRLMSVAEAFPKELAMQLGLEKAYSLVRYVAATPAEDVAGSLVDADARIDGRRLSAMSLRQLEAATKAVRARGRKAVRDPLERAARTAARGVQAALRKKGAHGAKASAAREDGVWVVRIAVPVEAVGVVTGDA